MCKTFLLWATEISGSTYRLYLTQNEPKLSRHLTWKQEGLILRWSQSQLRGPLSSSLNKSKDMYIFCFTIAYIKSCTFSRWKSLQEVWFWCRKLQFWSTGREFSPFDVWHIANIPPSDLPLKSRADVKKVLRNPSSSFWSMIVWKYRLTAIFKIAFAT